MPFEERYPTQATLAFANKIRDIGNKLQLVSKYCMIKKVDGFIPRPFRVSEQLSSGCYFISYFAPTSDQPPVVEAFQRFNCIKNSPHCKRAR